MGETAPARLSAARAGAFIAANTSLLAPPHVPEIRLHLASKVNALWRSTEEELAAIGLPPPFWAFAWAGGQGLARHVLDHPESVRGRSVLDFASGSGLVGIAAAMAGAVKVVCADTDPFSAEAARLNAAANRVSLRTTTRDLVGTPVTQDVVLAGDVFYDRALAERLTPWFSALVDAGKTVLVGDPGRAYLPRVRMTEQAAYEVATTRELEDSEVKRTAVWQFS